MSAKIIISSRNLLADNLNDHKPDQLITILGDNWVKDSKNVEDIIFDRPWLKLNFLDVEDATDPDGPKKDHIKQIMAFDNGGSMIVCCNGGISRSSATTIGLLCSRGFSAKEACNIAFDQKPSIWPNILILEWFDRLLGLGGILIEEARKTKAIPRCPDCFHALLTTLDEHNCTE